MSGGRVGHSVAVESRVGQYRQRSLSEGWDVSLSTLVTWRSLGLLVAG